MMLSIRSFLAVVSLVAVCNGASNSAGQSQQFLVDLKATTTSFDNSILTKCFGSSHAATALRANWREQLTQVQKDLGTEYVRFHGLLDDDMSAVIRARHRHSNFLEGAPGNSQKKNCTFVADQDFKDPGGGVFNASSAEECCQLCYNKPTGLPEPCVAAVYTKSGQCFFKLGANKPYSKPGSGLSACVTDRPSPVENDVAYSFINIFSIFDFLRSINMRPVIEVRAPTAEHNQHAPTAKHNQHFPAISHPLTRHPSILNVILHSSG
jgi:hypothetical protein